MDKESFEGEVVGSSSEPEAGTSKFNDPNGAVENTDVMRVEEIASGERFGKLKLDCVDSDDMVIQEFAWKTKVDLLHGCTRNSDHPGNEGEHLSTRERARVTPAGKRGNFEMETRKARSSEFERPHFEEQAMAKQIWIRFGSKTKPVEMRAGKTEGL